MLNSRELHALLMGMNAFQESCNAIYTGAFAMVPGAGLQRVGWLAQPSVELQS